MYEWKVLRAPNGASVGSLSFLYFQVQLAEFIAVSKQAVARSLTGLHCLSVSNYMGHNPSKR